VLDEEQGRLVARDAVAAALVGFGPRLVSAYLIGSLAHEGFVAAVSDVDIAVIVEGDEPGDPARVAEISRRVRQRGRSPLAERLSVFWSTADALRSGQPHGHLPAIDWLDLIDSGELVHGAALPVNTPRPTAAQLIADSAGFAVRKWREDPDWDRHLLDAAVLVRQGRRAASKAALFPVRFLYTLATGRAGGTHHAVAWYATQFQATDSAGDHVGRHVARPPRPGDVLRRPVRAAPSRALVDAAYQWRTRGFDDEAAAAGLLHDQLVPLYREFGRRYRQRLHNEGLEHLADELTATIARLEPVDRSK